MRSRLAVAVLLLSAAVAQANSGPPHTRCEREVKLVKAADGYAFYTRRTADKDAPLEVVPLSADRWAALPIRGNGKKESPVELYCATTDEAKRHESADKLLAAIRVGKALHSSLTFGTTAAPSTTWAWTHRPTAGRATLSRWTRRDK